MTINSETFKSAISRKIYDKDNSRSIRKEALQQGSDRPYFFVSQIDMSQSEERRGTYDRLYQMKVTYKVGIRDPRTRQKLETAGEELSELLTEVEIELGKNGEKKPVKASKLDYKIVDDVLQFFVNYKVKVCKDMEPLPKQNNLEVNTTIK